MDDLRNSEPQFLCIYIYTYILKYSNMLGTLSKFFEGGTTTANKSSVGLSSKRLNFYLSLAKWSASMKYALHI
jgi:hypothetical protein